MRFVRILAVLASLLFLALPALAQDSAPDSQIVITDPTGGLLSAVPGGIYIYALLVAAASLVSVFVKDSSLPPIVAKALNALAGNVGRAKNDPGAN